MKGVSSILLVLVLVSCETNMTDDDWPEHDAKLVILACVRFTSDSVLVSCRVTRTAGLEENFNGENAMIDDAEVLIYTSDRTFRLHDLGTPRQSAILGANYFSGFLRLSEPVYTLEVRRGNMLAHALLFISDIPLTMDTVVVSYDNHPGDLPNGELHYVLQTPLKRVDYWMKVEELWSTGLWHRTRWESGSLATNVRTNPTVGVYKYGSNPGILKTRYTLVALSPGYRNFQDTQWHSNYSGSPFEPDENNPPFNITGDGIGFFWYELVGEPIEIPY